MAHPLPLSYFLILAQKSYYPERILFLNLYALINQFHNSFLQKMSSQYKICVLNLTKLIVKKIALFLKIRGAIFDALSNVASDIEFLLEAYTLSQKSVDSFVYQFYKNYQWYKSLVVGHSFDSFGIQQIIHHK